MLRLERLLIRTISRVASQHIADFATQLFRRLVFKEAVMKVTTVFQEIPFFTVRPEALVGKASRRDFELNSTVLLF